MLRGSLFTGAAEGWAVLEDEDVYHPVGDEEEEHHYVEVPPVAEDGLDEWEPHVAREAAYRRWRR